MHAPGSEPPREPFDDVSPDVPPDLSETLRQLGHSGKAGLSAANDAAKALRILVSADISLARSAFGRTLAFTGVAIAFGASAWMLLMGTVVAALHEGLGWSFTGALAICAAISLVATAAGGWIAMRYFEHTRMQATRRQLARLGIGELASFMPTPGSGASAEDAAEVVKEKSDNGDEPPKKGLGIDVTPP